MTREDIECIIKWFSHIEQLATDGKTANGFQMPTDKILATIKVVAKDSREYVEKFCNDSVPNDLKKAAREYGFEEYRRRCNGGEYGTSEDAFIAGAKWAKEQIMREAVEGEVCIPNVWVEHKEGQELVVRAEISKELGFKFGEKVRIIIVKE